MGHIRDRWKDPGRAGKGRRWQVKYQVDGVERDGGSFEKKPDAKRRLTELEAGLHQGRWIDPTNPLTVTELVRRRMASRTYKPRTQVSLDSLIRNHVESTPLGSRRVVAVKPSEVQVWVTDRAQHLSPLTLRNVVKFVRAAFNDAVVDHVIPSSPFQRITTPRVERHRIVPLTVEQVRAVADVIGPRYRAMVITQAGLGLRIGELLALRVQDVDFLPREVRVVHQVDQLTRELVDPKTPRSRRTVPLPHVVATALAEHLREWPAAPNGLIFHTRDGLPHAHNQYGNKVFVPAARKAGLPPGTTTHDLRHHFASVLLAAGESVVAVADRLGHDRADLVLSTYGHLMPNLEDRTRKAVDSAWNAVSDGPAEPATAQGRPR